MRGTTQEWLETNPLNCTSGCNHTNWDGPVREFSRDALSFLPADIGLGGSVPLEQLGPATSSDEQMLLQLLQFGGFDLLAAGGKSPQVAVWRGGDLG